MSDFKAWNPPPGAVVSPPVHPETTVRCMYSDGAFDYVARPAGSINWSSEGDGPRVVAYSVVQEYVAPPKVARDFWIVDGCEIYTNERDAIDAADGLRYKYSVIHVREVLPAAREVVAWAVVDDQDGDTTLCDDEGSANYVQRKYGGTVVRLTGAMP